MRCWVCCLLVAITGCTLPGEGQKEDGAAMIVETGSGKVRGEALNDVAVNVWRGIPYAAPPVGERRFRPPTAAVAWDGVREARDFSDSCYQARHTSGFVWRREDFPVSEDCLYLNVWSAADADKMPVMVWFHGGAHTSGQGHSEIFDGTALAQAGVVVVTINYRLGVFGFLAHPWLAGESDQGSAGNYGLLDKVAALQWVQDNIAGFGGDPGNVTIFGQSAGSQSVCSLQVSPLAKGLFHKAIGQSASCVGVASRRDSNGFVRGEKLVQALAAASPEALRDLPAQQLLDVSEASGWTSASRITVDGWVVPDAHNLLFAQGRFHPVPLLLGSLADEGNQLFPVNEALDEAGLQAYAASVAPDRTEALLALYRDSERSPGQIQHAISTDLFMAFGMRRWAEYSSAAGMPTYLYFMPHVPPAFHLYMPEDPVLELEGGPRSGGAYHSGDLAYVFGTVDRVGYDWREDDRSLSKTMVKYWTNFARTGNPAGEGVPAWPAFTPESLATQVLSADVHSEKGVRQAALDIFGEAHPR